MVLGFRTNVTLSGPDGSGIVTALEEIVDEDGGATTTGATECLATVCNLVLGPVSCTSVLTNNKSSASSIEASTKVVDVLVGTVLGLSVLAYNKSSASSSEPSAEVAAD